MIYLNKKWKLAALLHDAPEYVIGDMISPVKAKVGPGYDELDNRLMAAILLRFGLPSEIPVKIKRSIKVADKMSAWLESTQIAGFDKFEAGQNLKRLLLMHPRLICVQIMQQL